MKYTLKHNTQDYIQGSITLWIYKFYNRATKQRIRLTLLLIIIFLTFFLYSNWLGTSFLLIVSVIIIIDFIVNITETIKEKSRIEKYIMNGGEDIEIIHDNYFAFLQDQREFHKRNGKMYMKFID